MVAVEGASFWSKSASRPPGLGPLWQLGPRPCPPCPPWTTRAWPPQPILGPRTKIEWITTWQQLLLVEDSSFTKVSGSFRCKSHGIFLFLYLNVNTSTQIRWNSADFSVEGKSAWQHDRRRVKQTSKKCTEGKLTTIATATILIAATAVYPAAVKLLFFGGSGMPFFLKIMFWIIKN